MPSSTRPATPGQSNVPQSAKRAMPDAESPPQDPKKPRRTPSAEPSTRRDSTRDARRRKKKRKKAPIVGAGVAKNEPPQTTPGERSRAPLSARNDIIRFTSPSSAVVPPPTTVPAPEHSSQELSAKLLGKASSNVLDDAVDRDTEHVPSSPRVQKNCDISTNRLPESSSSSLKERVAQLEAELASKNTLIASHQALLNQIQQAVTCQVCLDLMYKPYALAPCGHLACHSCLVNWFTIPPQDDRQAPPATMRRKTCPHCRATVRERPVEVWGVKGISRAAGKSGLLQNQLPVPVEGPENVDATHDPWKDIFPKSGPVSHRAFSWFFPGADIHDDDIHDDIAPRGEDLGMLDVEDGGIYRCLDCMHEIWDGVCTSCGRVYPGHRPEEDDGDDENEEDTVAWLEDQMGAEEVDVADDPGWIGLEGGEADDAGAMNDWPSMGGRFGNPFLYVDDEDVSDTYSGVADLRASYEDEEDGDEGYESSFIDDAEDEGCETADFENGPRIYEIYDGDDDEPGTPEHGWAQRSRVSIVASSDEEVDELGDGAGLGWGSDVDGYY